MKYLIGLVRTILNKKLCVTSIHECSHIVIANHFKNSIVINYVTLNKDKIEKIKKENGYISTDTFSGFTDFVPKHNYDLDFNKNYLTVGWGSAIAETISKIGYDSFFSNKEYFLQNPNMMELNNFGGDYERIKQIGKKLFKDKEQRLRNEYKDRKFTIEFFENKPNWNKVIELSNVLISKCNLTLSSKEIKKILDK